jgi:hypothetical protein
VVRHAGRGVGRGWSRRFNAAEGIAAVDRNNSSASILGVRLLAVVCHLSALRPVVVTMRSLHNWHLALSSESSNSAERWESRWDLLMTIRMLDEMFKLSSIYSCNSPTGLVVARPDVQVLEFSNGHGYER